MPILEVQHLNKVFTDTGGTEFQALNDVSFTVEERECVGLIGESGSGKSTVANIVAGFLPATSGVVIYDGTELTGRKCPKQARDIIEDLWDDKEKLIYGNTPMFMICAVKK